MKKFIYACLGMSLVFTSAHAAYPKYKKHSHQKIKGDGSYLWYMSKIKKKYIKTIFEIGSRDAKDAIELSDLCRCHVFAFECNPTAIEICRKNIGLNPNVTLVPAGVWDETGELAFYRVIDGNIGASSFFEFNPNARNYPDILEEGLVQEKIIVPTVRLDEFLQTQGIENIDLLCMDVQGAAYQVLRSLGEQINKVKYIIVELETHPIYSGEILYQDVDRFLIDSGFIRASDPLDPTGLFGDVLYIHRSVL
jgi:FkbM family methyltransferase